MITETSGCVASMLFVSDGPMNSDGSSRDPYFEARKQRRHSQTEFGSDQTQGKCMRIRKSPDVPKTGLPQYRAQRLKIKVRHMLRHFKRRPTPSHNPPQCASNIRRSQNNMPARLGVARQAFDER